MRHVVKAGFVFGAALLLAAPAVAPAQVRRDRGLPFTIDPDGFARTPKPLTKMTLDEIDTYQTAILRDQALEQGSAIGRYGLTRAAIRNSRRTLKVSGDELFSAELQDIFAATLMNRRGYALHVQGRIKPEIWHDQIAHEWTSLTTPRTGKTVYGNPPGPGAETAAEVFAQDVEAPPK